MNKLPKKVSISIFILILFSFALLFLNRDNMVHYASGYLASVGVISFIFAIPSLLISVPDQTKYLAKFFIYLLASLITFLSIFSAGSMLAAHSIGFEKDYQYSTKISRIDKKRPVKNSSPSVCNFGAWWYDTNIKNYIYHCTDEKTYNKWLLDKTKMFVEVDARIVLWGHATKINSYKIQTD